MKIISMLAFLLALLASVNTYAENKTKQFLSSKEFQTLLYSLGVYWDKKILNIALDCHDKYYIKPISLAIIKPLVFNKNSLYPTDGIITYRYRFTRCGKSIVYNALVVARNGGTPQLSALVPGTTYCSPVLLRDYYTMGLPSQVALKSKNNKCQSLHVLNTELTLAPKAAENRNGVPLGTWEELWTVKFCDETLQVRVCFEPDGEGGTNWYSGSCRKRK